MRLLLIFAFALAPTLASAQIFKCTGSDGKVTLTDKPCASTEAAEAIVIPPPPETGLQKRQREQAEQRQADKAKHEKLISDLRATRDVLQAESDRQKALFAKRVAQEGLVIGMSFQQVNDHPVWGLPNKINNTTTAGGVRSQWIYPVSLTNQFEMIYLYFVNGRLSTIQN